MHYEKPRLHPEPRLYLRYFTILRTQNEIKMLPHIYDHITVTPFIKKKAGNQQNKKLFFLMKINVNGKQREKNKLIYEKEKNRSWIEDKVHIMFGSKK